jgi:ATP-binding cassette subfamily B protein
MTLPLGFKTKIGDNGLEVSQGQRQRIFIARTIYKDPQYIFFDEATNSLDANNERLIIENLNDYFRKNDKLGNQRTVIFVAHRLSTVQNADKIVVIADGRVVEEGNHESLIRRKGNYYQLVKNQLELNP